MSAPITGQTITFEQISETLRTQYSDAEKRLQDSNKTQVDPMRLNKNPKSLDNDIRTRLENKPMLAPPEMQVSDSDNATTAKTNDARLTMILGNLTGIADQILQHVCIITLTAPCFDTKWHIISFVN